MKKFIFLLILPLFLGLGFSECTCRQKQVAVAPTETVAPPPVVKETPPPPPTVEETPKGSTPGGEVYFPQSPASGGGEKSVPAETIPKRAAKKLGSAGGGPKYGSVAGGEEYPAPMPEPVEAMDGETGPFWNTWFENIDSGKRVEKLRKDKTFSFYLDISRYSYFAKWAAAADTDFQKVINEAHDRGDTTLRFIIRPILHGDFLRFAKGQRPWRVLEVNINKLFQEDKAVEERIEKMRNDNLQQVKLHDLAREAQAGGVMFNLDAQSVGDATITITIWDAKGMIPLDHLSVSVPVVDESTTAVEHDLVCCTIPLVAGRETLLDVSSEFSSTGPLIADAAFYVFEESPRPKRSTVLFAAKAGAGGTEGADEVSVYAWETKSLLSQYIEGQDQFIIKIKEARERAISIDENVWKYSYQLAADQLRKKIFGGNTPKDKKQASDAERVFHDLVQRKEQPSIVFVRMRNEWGDPVYLPLGILAASSRSPILGKRIVLVQPLPRERYPGEVNPVASWTFNVPEELEDLSIKSNEALRKFGKNPPYLRDISTVKGFFESAVPPAGSTSPEGVLLLAHQAGGNLWFTDQANGVIPEEIGRIFPEGSVAILSACSTASSKENNQAILEKLNENGIDAMIISPFPVHADYGAMLAVHFVQAIEDAKSSSKSLSLAELFSKASQQTANYFENEQDKHYDDMDLEFLIAGDYRIRITPNNVNSMKGEKQ